MLLKIFMTTVKEYKRFINELPIDHEIAINDVLTDKAYVFENVRLMLLRKYIQSSHSGGDVYIPNVIAQAKVDFPEDETLLDDLLKDYTVSCEQTLRHILSIGTERTLIDTINDIIYGLFLHGDSDKVLRLSKDDENIRNYCIVLFVKEVERVLLNLFNYLEKQGVETIEQENYTSAPVISFDADDNANNITGSPYWKNLKGIDIDESNAEEYYSQFFNDNDSNDIDVWITAYAFFQALANEGTSLSDLKQLVCSSTLNSWGDFSDARNAWSKINSPGISSKVRYNEDKSEAYVHVFPNVIEGFAIESKYLVPNIYILTLRKDTIINQWKVFSFKGRF